MFDRLLRDEASRQALGRSVTGVTLLTIALDRAGFRLTAETSMEALVPMTGVLLAAYVEWCRRGLD